MSKEDFSCNDNNFKNEKCKRNSLTWRKSNSFLREKHTVSIIAYFISNGMFSFLFLTENRERIRRKSVQCPWNGKTRLCHWKRTECFAKIARLYPWKHRQSYRNWERGGSIDVCISLVAIFDHFDVTAAPSRLIA